MQCVMKTIKFAVHGEGPRMAGIKGNSGNLYR